MGLDGTLVNPESATQTAGAGSQALLLPGGGAAEPPGHLERSVRVGSRPLHLADLDEMTVGVPEVAAEFRAPVPWRRQERRSPAE